MTVPFTALVNFTSPREPAARSEESREFPHCTYITVPFEKIALEPQRIAISDLRGELEASGVTVETQLDARGFAIAKDVTSISYTDFNTPEGIERYIAETCEMVKQRLEATAVYSWNHHLRKSVKQDGPPSLDDPPKPESSLPAGRAHVDQNTPRARELIGEAGGEIGLLPGNRAQIVNVWRPVKGPVEDFPLAMCDYRTLSPEDTVETVDHFGKHYSVLYNPNQKWSYVRDQMPNEIIFLRCYDTLEGEDGHAIYAPHTAFLDEARQDCKEPRESIEVRCAVVHENWQSTHS